MTDDAELRARIAAQQAARRARPSGSDREQRTDDEDERPASSGERRARPLTPRRPWTSATRTGGQPPGPRPGGQPGRLTPARPWADERPDAGRSPTAAPSASTSSTQPRSRGRLTPARPWAGKSPAAGEPSAPAPSNPEVVLRGLAEVAAEPEPATPERRRLRGRRHAPSELDALPEPAVSASADVPAETTEPAEPAAPADSPPPTEVAEPDERYPWQRQEEVDLDLHGAPTWDPGMYPPEPESTEGSPGRRALRWLFARAPEPPAPEPPAPEPAPEPPAPAADAEPDEPAPEEAHVEPADAPERRSPASPTPAVQPTPRRPSTKRRPEPGTTFEPGSDAVLDIELADQLGEAPAVAGWDPEPPPPTGETAAEPPVESEASRRPSMLSRLFTRRRTAEADEDDYEEFRLPAPDAAFERPWLRSAPHPTRDWSEATPEWAPPELAAEPQRPEPELEPEPAAEPQPPAAAPVRPRPRPSPRSAAAPPPVTPSTAAPLVEPVPLSAPSGRPSPRPKPGAPRQPAGHAGISSAPAHHSPFERAPLPPPRPSRQGRQSDLSRFHKASDTDSDDEEGDSSRTAARRRRRDKRRRWSVLGVLWVCIIGAAALLLRTFVVQPYYIPSESMEPTLHGCAGCTDDHVLVDKISYKIHDVGSGDIVVFHKPKGDPSPEKVLIKRVIGLPGDTLQLKQGHVYVNGLLLPEPYVNKKCGPQPTQPLTSTSKWTIPENDVFVMGDNRCHSDDSRVFGPIATSRIVGRAFAVIWPLNRIRTL